MNTDMVNTQRMKFKDFVFPSNPSELKIKNERRIAVSAVPGKNSVTQSVSNKPVIISGSGKFYGDDMTECCQRLSRILKSNSSGWLFCPGAYPMAAFLTEFLYSLSADKSSASYSFVFTEDCNDASSEKLLKKTYAVTGENAFDIANRCNDSIDDIMKLNNFETPFDLKGGEVVRLR